MLSLNYVNAFMIKFSVFWCLKIGFCFYFADFVCRVGICLFPRLDPNQQNISLCLPCAGLQKFTTRPLNTNFKTLPKIIKYFKDINTPPMTNVYTMFKSASTVEYVSCYNFMFNRKKRNLSLNLVHSKCTCNHNFTVFRGKLRNIYE